MLKVVDDEKLIAKCARQFARSFKPFLDEKIRVKLGHQGASFGAKVAWSKKLGMWIFSRATGEVRYWNAFGTERPGPDAHLPITAEINFPRAGIDRKTGAAFAQDAWKNIYVIHRGKIGGGKKGIGKSLFEESYRGVWSWMEDGDTLARVALVGKLGDGRFALQVAQFVRKVEKLKSSAFQSAQTQLDFSEISFREEWTGQPPEAAAVTIYDCDHDLIVGQLAALLRRWKYRIGNDAGTDLFVTDPRSGVISHLIGVSTGNSDKEVLSAAAALLLRQSVEPGRPATLLVMPEELMIRYAQDLRRIAIEALAFRREDDRIVFPDLGKIRLDQNSQL